MDRVHHHERGDDPLGLGGIEPCRRERDMNAPRQLALGRGGGGRGDSEQGNQGASSKADTGHRLSPHHGYVLGMRAEREERRLGHGILVQIKTNRHAFLARFA